MPNLSHWSWQELIRTYKAYASAYPKPGDIVNLEDIQEYEDRKALLDKHIAVLDHEIARRNNLIGVMG